MSEKQTERKRSENNQSRIPQDNRNKAAENGRNRMFQNGRNRTKESGRREDLKTTSKTSTDTKAKTSINSNREFAVVTYIFLIIFLVLIAYFAYFMLVKSNNFINSAYNPRLDSMSKTVVRGEILSRDGDILAKTETDSEGNETRVYPYGRIFAHVVGYSANGKSGIESVENFDLLRSHTFFLEQIVNDLKDEKNAGDNVITTLDTAVQTAAYEALGSYDGAVVAIQPSTGKVLAMVSKPDFDPNTIMTDWDSLINSESSMLLNRATQGLYPPGSIFKILTTLEFMRENPGYAAYNYDCTGSISDGVNEIHCYGGSVHGQEDIYTSFAKSCNTSFANIGLSLDLGSYSELCSSLLFNKSVSFELPTNKSQFTLGKSAGTSQIMQTAIGQGETLVTPFHMAMITSAICNNGTLMRPYLVDHTENENGDPVEENEPKVYDKLISEEEAAVLRQFMSNTVENGTASALSGQVYTASGKTGTAEFNSNKDSHAWFVGFASMEGKEDIAVAVIVEDSGAGSSYAVPVAKSVFDAYFNE